MRELAGCMQHCLHTSVVLAPLMRVLNRWAQYLCNSVDGLADAHRHRQQLAIHVHRHQHARPHGRCQVVEHVGVLAAQRALHIKAAVQQRQQARQLLSCTTTQTSSP